MVQYSTVFPTDKAEGINFALNEPTRLLGKPSSTALLNILESL